MGTYAPFPAMIDELEHLVKKAVNLAWQGGTDVGNIESLGGGWKEKTTEIDGGTAHAGGRVQAAEGTKE